MFNTQPCGAASRDHFPYRPNIVLVTRWNKDIHDLPGDHVGYWSEPKPFATALATLTDTMSK